MSLPNFTQHPMPGKDRVEKEDALKHLHEASWRGGNATMESLAGSLGITNEAAGALLDKLQGEELVEPSQGGWQLTSEGNAYALKVIRAHRLFESYLAHESGVRAEYWHQMAHDAEHRLSAEQVDAISDRLGRPRFDPHGDPIPTRQGLLQPHAGRPLHEWQNGEEGLICHVEDEPAQTFKRLLKLGIYAGMRLKRIGESDQGLAVIVEGRDLILSRQEAAQISLQSLDELADDRADFSRLSDLAVGERGEIAGLSPYFRGAERTRLLDLGFVPGSQIERAFSSPLGTPIAFYLRGTTVALRREQAEQVYLKKPRPHS